MTDLGERVLNAYAIHVNLLPSEHYKTYSKSSFSGGGAWDAVYSGDQGDAEGNVTR